MFDYQIVKKNYQRAKPQIKEHGFLYEIAAQEIMDALSGLNLNPSSVLVLGYFPHVRLLQKQIFHLEASQAVKQIALTGVQTVLSN